MKKEKNCFVKTTACFMLSLSMLLGNTCQTYASEPTESEAVASTEAEKSTEVSKPSPITESAPKAKTESAPESSNSQETEKKDDTATNNLTSESNSNDQATTETPVETTKPDTTPTNEATQTDNDKINDASKKATESSSIQTCEDTDKAEKQPVRIYFEDILQNTLHTKDYDFTYDTSTETPFRLYTDEFVLVKIVVNNKVSYLHLYTDSIANITTSYVYTPEYNSTDYSLMKTIVDDNSNLSNAETYYRNSAYDLSRLDPSLKNYDYTNKDLLNYMQNSYVNQNPDNEATIQDFVNKASIYWNLRDTIESKWKNTSIAITKWETNNKDRQIILNYDSKDLQASLASETHIPVIAYNDYDKNEAILLFSGNGKIQRAESVLLLLRANLPVKEEPKTPEPKEEIKESTPTSNTQEETIEEEVKSTQKEHSSNSTGTKTTTIKHAKKQSSPKTGDYNNASVYLILVILSALAIIYTRKKAF